jgi:hypothetical protein
MAIYIGIHEKGSEVDTEAIVLANTTAQHFYPTIDAMNGIRAVYGLTGKQTMPLFETALNQLNAVDNSPKVFDPTLENAKEALRHLIKIAKHNPRCIWGGD